MKLGYKFWIAFRVAVLRRGFGSMRPLLSRASFSVNVSLGGWECIVVRLSLSVLHLQ